QEVQRFRASLVTGCWPGNPEPLVRDANGDYVEYVEWLLAEGKANDYLRMLNDTISALKQIYAEHGEDEKIAGLCTPLIEKTRMLVD
ncbi:MAG: hypothetical protein ACPGSN_10140, partial [Psychrobium sp.]